MDFERIPMEDFTHQELREALRAIGSMIGKCEKCQPKLKPGTSQATLLRNRIKALRLSESLIKRELGHQDL